MTHARSSLRRSVATMLASGMLGAGLIGVSTGTAAAQSGICDLPDTLIIETCAMTSEVTYTVHDAQGNLVKDVLPGQTYQVQVHKHTISPVPFESIEKDYVMQNNEVRLDFINDKGESTMDDIRMNADGKFETQGKIKSARGASDKGTISNPGALYIPREARNSQGIQAPQIEVHYVDGSSEMAYVPMNVLDSDAARHEIKLRNYAGQDMTDRSLVSKIEMMIGKQEVISVENNIVRGDEDEVPPRMFIMDEYGNEDVEWARLEQFQLDGQDRHRLRLMPGNEQLDNGNAKVNKLYVSTQFQDGTWRTNQIEVTVRPHEELKSAQSLPSVTIEPWTVTDVKLEGDPPTDNGELHYENHQDNPSWVRVNKYSGMVTYAPQMGTIAYGDYPIVIDVHAESGANMQIKSSVKVVPHKDTLNPHSNIGVDRSGTNTNTGNGGDKPQKKGIFARFWDSVTSMFD